MNTITYKGYIGSVAYSEKDDIFFGKIEGINALVNFEGESVTELKPGTLKAKLNVEGTRIMKTLVRELDVHYRQNGSMVLAFCEEEGIQPHKSYSGSLNVRISPETHSQIAILASKAGISINAFIKQALDRQVAMLL